MSETKNDTPINWGAAPFSGKPPEMKIKVTLYPDQDLLAQLTSAVFAVLNNSQFDALPDNRKSLALKFISDSYI